MEDERSVHLVCSAGGVRCLSYFGALKVLAAHGVGVRSIAACSGGTIVGALLAFGADMRKAEAFAVEKGFRSYQSRPKYPFFSLLSFLRYPFSKYKASEMPRFFVECFGSDPMLGEAKIPFSTVAVDIVNDRFVVFSSQTHPEMRVSEAIRIAVAVPGMYAPVEREHRVLVDAAVSTASPVWLATASSDDAPIVVLKPRSHENFSFKKSFGGFIGELFLASSQSRDWYMMQADPRVRAIEINYDEVRVEDFGLDALHVQRLISNGAEEMEKMLPFLWARPEKLARRAAFSDDDAGEQRAADLISRYRAALASPRNQVFLSYHQKDAAVLERLRLHLEPFRLQSGLQIWSDRSIDGGDVIESEIQKAIEKTKVAVLLVSADYLASDCLWCDQLAVFTEAARQKQVKLIWLLVKSCGFELTELQLFQPANDASKPLASLEESEQEAVLARAAKAIQSALLG